MTGSLYSHDAWNIPREPEIDRAQRAAGLYLLEAQRANSPGPWTDNVEEQANHFDNVIYIAIRAIMDVIAGSTVTLQHHKPRKGKSTFGPSSHVTKAMPNAHAMSHAEEWEPVNDHPICKMLKRPNVVDSFADLRSYLTLQNRLTGIAPLWCVPSKGGKPVELWALPSALTVPLYQRTPQYPQGAWRVQPYYLSGGLGYVPAPYSGTGAIVPGEEMARFTDPHPWFLWSGYSPLSAGSFQLDILEMIDQARFAAMDHGITMDAVLTVEGLDEPQARRLQADMQNKHGGVRNHRKFAVVAGSSGNLKTNLQTFSQSAKDMDFQQGWEQMSAFCLALFGVPKSVAGLAMTSSYSELYASLRQFYFRQESYVRRQDEFFTKALCRPYEKRMDEYRIHTDLQKLDDPDLLERQLSADTGIRSVNDRRAIRQLPPVKFGEYPEGIFLKLLEQDALEKHKPKTPPPPAQVAKPVDPREAPPAQPYATAAPGSTPAPAQQLEALPGGNPDSQQGVPGQGPTAGAAPSPDNPLAAFTRPPLQKSASAHRFSNAMVLLPVPIAERMRALAAMVPDADLGDDGREDEPHVTARYGLHTDDPLEVVPHLVGCGPIELHLGKVSVFAGKDVGKPYDVLKIDVDSPDLHRLHGMLGELEHTDTWPEYHPHATIAYVRAGLGKKYAKLMGDLDQDVTIDRLVFTNRLGEKRTISLVGTLKAMSAFCEGAGADVVPPPAQATTTRKRKRRKSVIAAKRFAGRLLKSLESQYASAE